MTSPLETKLTELEAKARVSPEVAFDSHTESGMFYSAASPDVVLKLVETVRLMSKLIEESAKSECYVECSCQMYAKNTLAKVGDLWK